MSTRRRPQPDRRAFLGTLAAAAVATTASAAPAPAKRNLALGFDNFSIRALAWKASRMVEYAGQQRVDVVLFSDLDVFESLEDAALRELKAKADALGVALQVGTGSLCPTSSAFDKRRGSPDEHLALLLRVAQAVGSKVARCYLGTSNDRRGDGGIERHIEAMVGVLKRNRTRIVDAGVTVGVENHAGDMQGWELVSLIEAAGKDYVGATMDPGNAVWALEEPQTNLEALGPYAVTTGLRDSMLWETPQGAQVCWTNMGEGQIDWRAYFDRYAQLCPKVPAVLEIISWAIRPMPYWQEEFWSVYPKARAREFARFARLAKTGRDISAQRPRTAQPQLQQESLEASLRYCREVLGLGLK